MVYGWMNGNQGDIQSFPSGIPTSYSPSYTPQPLHLAIGYIYMPSARKARGALQLYYSHSNPVDQPLLSRYPALGCGSGVGLFLTVLAGVDFRRSEQHPTHSRYVQRGRGLRRCALILA